MPATGGPCGVRPFFRQRGETDAILRRLTGVPRHLFFLGTTLGVGWPGSAEVSVIPGKFDHHHKDCVGVELLVGGIDWEAAKGAAPLFPLHPRRRLTLGACVVAWSRRACRHRSAARRGHAATADQSAPHARAQRPRRPQWGLAPPALPMLLCLPANHRRPRVGAWTVAGASLLGGPPHVSRSFPGLRHQPFAPPPLVGRSGAPSAWPHSLLVRPYEWAGHPCRLFGAPARGSLL